MELKYNGHSKKSGVYKITNLTTGIVYIGSAKCFQKRAYQHFSSLKNNKHQNKHLQASFNKHGAGAFLFEVIEVVPGDKTARTTREQFFIDQELSNWKKCFNFKKKTIAKERSCFSRTPEESQKKLSEARRKLWSDPVYKAKMSAARKKQWLDPAYREKILRNIDQTGRLHTAEAKTKVSVGLKKRYADGMEPWNKGKKTGITPWLGKKRGPMPEEQKIKHRQAAKKAGQCVPVEQWTKDKKTLIKIWDSVNQACKQLGMGTSHVIGVLNPNVRRFSAGGFFWKRHQSS